MEHHATGRAAGVPWHLWVVGGLGTIWNAFGAFDYLMTQTRNESYMGQFTAEQLDYFYGFPAWVVALWALAVWAGLLGTILLLLRRRLAVNVLAASFGAMILMFVQNYLLDDAMTVGGVEALAFTGVIFLVALGLWLYGRAMANRQILF